MIYRIIQANTKEYEQLHMEYIGKSTSDVDLVVVCISEAGEVYGYASFEELDAEYVRLLYIQVAESHQRKGIGKRLVYHAAFWYAQREKKGIYIFSDVKKCHRFFDAVDIKVSARGKIYTYRYGEIKEQQELVSEEIMDYSSYVELEKQVNFLWEYHFVNPGIDFGNSVFMVRDHNIYGALIGEIWKDQYVFLNDFYMDTNVEDTMAAARLLYRMIQQINDNNSNPVQLLIRCEQKILDKVLVDFLGSPLQRTGYEERYADLESLWIKNELDVKTLEPEKKLLWGDEFGSPQIGSNPLVTGGGNRMSAATKRYIQNKDLITERLLQNLNIPTIDEGIYRLYYPMQEVYLSVFGLMMDKLKRYATMPEFLEDMESEVEDATYYLLDKENIMYELYTIDRRFTCVSYLMDYMCGSVFGVKVENDVVYITKIYMSPKHPDPLAIPLMLYKILDKMKKELDENAILVIDVQSRKQKETISELIGSPCKSESLRG